MSDKLTSEEIGQTKSNIDGKLSELRGNIIVSVFFSICVALATSNVMWGLAMFFVMLTFLSIMNSLLHIEESLEKIADKN